MIGGASRDIDFESHQLIPSRRVSSSFNDMHKKPVCDVSAAASTEATFSFSSESDGVSASLKLPASTGGPKPQWLIITNHAAMAETEVRRDYIREMEELEGSLKAETDALGQAITACHKRQVTWRENESLLLENRVENSAARRRRWWPRFVVKAVERRRIARERHRLRRDTRMIDIDYRRRLQEVRAHYAARRCEIGYRYYREYFAPLLAMGIPAADPTITPRKLYSLQGAAGCQW
ncbi:hypothetical protein B0T22DRAFT_437243 [Podospora appendiculata]|uniref:Uncharacterized protein n=1 Tax=Podospora appendiculata TaxID=314037 RepID=A0AAE0XIL0_9PEZI|nr:hypothetical protein B0T22DRAFT_437243 [Podospora appendiculata]